ncbi:MAG: CHC2 zinc finger domain-containing protein, partial [Chloroflexi bacterium]|nr:CHC2 zinc finger domain-containing protein [Chloroflexota bacterium]
MTAPGWKQATRRDPCVACGHVGWCAYSLDGNMIMCRRVDTGEGIPRTDSNGSDYWLYPRDTNITFDPSRMPPPAPTAERASPDMLHDVYGAFLAELPLNQLHRQELAARGLSPEAIKRLGFKSMPGEGRAAIARKLEEQFGRSTLLKTPGFYVKDEGGSNWISIAGSAGLLIPIPDHEGRLVALQTRLDNPGDYGKYLSFSSTGHDGPGPGSQVVWPLGAYNVPGDPLRLAEGILKGIVANELSGVTTLGLPGNYIPDFLILLLQDMEPSEVILALDADARKNLHVAKSLQTCVYKLDEAGLPMALEVWDPSHGKGIDDMLAGGHTPDLLRSHKAHQRVHEIVQAAMSEFNLLSEAHLGPADIGHTAMPIFRLTLAAIPTVSGGRVASAAKIVPEITLDQCPELRDWIEELDTSEAIPLPGADNAPFASGNSYWQSTVLPLLKKRIASPDAKPYKSGNIFKAVKNAVRLEDVAAKFCDLQPAGRDKMRARCPLHSERSPSFVVYIETQSWHCYGA